MSENPAENRHLADKAMDHIDHALGRPIWPLRETARNYFAINAGGDLARAHDASEYRSLNGVSAKMVYYAVTDVGRAALVAHLAGLERQENAFAVTFEGGTTIVQAETASKARYRLSVRFSDCWSDLTFASFRLGATVRRAA